MEVINKRRKVHDLSAASLLEEPAYKPEIIRLILQSLRTFGYSESAAQLEAESGVILEEKSVAQFKLGVLEGHWDEVAALIPEFNLKSEEQKQVMYCVMQQKYLELIEKQDYLQALDCLRNEVVPLKPEDTATLHTLASHLLCSTTQELMEDAAWEGSGSQARRNLLHLAQTHIPPTVMIPPDRLQSLICQALESQVTSCKYHYSSSHPLSLLDDHRCSKDGIVFATVQHIQSMNNELWDCAFSRNGEELAIVKKDGELVVWRLSEDNSWIEEFDLSADVIKANSVSWTGEGTLMVGGLDGVVKVVEGRGIVRSFACHSEAISSCFWVGGMVVSGSVDNSLVFCKPNGEKIQSTRMRVRQIEVSADDHIIAVLSACTVHAAKNSVTLFDSPSHSVLRVFEEDDHVTAIAISRSGAEVLTNTSLVKPVGYRQQLHLWDVAETKIAQIYEGHNQQKYSLKPCFGGKMCEFVLCGSEDGFIFVWNKAHGTLLSRLAGHTAAVGSYIGQLCPMESE